MAVHPERGNYPPVLALDQPIPSHVLGRRDAVSFCSSNSYFTVPRFERRGGISFDRSDKNAIYVRTLADVKMRAKPEKTAPLGNAKSSILESEHRVLERLTLPEYKMRFRSRFLSLHKVHRRRRPVLKVVGHNKVLLDSHYGNQAQCLLSELGHWDFNVFSLDTLSAGRSLFHIAFQLFQNYDLISVFHLDVLKLMRCFTLLESGYHDNNSYHNAVHAADVTQAMHCFLQEPKLRNCVTSLEVMVAFIGSMSHDLDHPGVNNTFLIATANHLATLYNNSSVLENHHWRSAVGVLQETRVFDHLPRDQWDDVVKQIKSLILATDITRQQEFLLKFRRRLDNEEFDYVNNSDDRHFILQIALKCADICNPCRMWSLSKVWSEKVVEEFFNQGDTEKALHIPVTPLCNRKSNTVAKIQAGFMEFVVTPLFMEWYRFMPSDLSRRLLDNIAKNKIRWKKIIDEEALQVHESDSSSSKNEHSNDDPDDSDEEEEEVEDDVCSEENDVVENDINLAYHYDSEQMSESGRSLSPVSEDVNVIIVPGSRRHSMPPVFIRRDLNFYLGIRRDSGPKVPLLRRQSLPTTTLFKSTSADITVSPAVVKEVRSLSMEALMSRPKISNLSPSIEASRLASGLEYLNFVPLKNQTLVLQRGSITKFTSSQRTINSLSDITFQSNRPLDRDDLRLYSDSLKNDRNLPNVGLASSWPTISPKAKIISKGIPGVKLQTNISFLAQKENEPRGDNCDVIADNPPICLSEKQRDAAPGRPH
ncbi:high affinity cAMP-specific 3',5'-cyclic phosphodiesterase 7A-like isoform X1 [Haliotis rubra]|uniref:high affinity cAMP-specific 3',5'-cyclic phosphodiesterase 7A-like isoform X1 n=1 Tax=Haliotis rubra TaxID=36100 RepID=UPI001EE5E11C|nr:high affinity cAMP-specific 3',5'-cyclic phosphodiesterase 7A-like isoform X1 [Haliotis rubra]XP_046566809.1 high affinity cAMP-specific 3',5'-cyclic phosphodiesterase 7A-like isoform X1 [Haliotis rubra]XP_046566811.1 high affinity cAMP-specific 3',5'-cyclic phosphodiesterase 7A-like isoform X1 [Haliotis rubra]